MALFVIFTLYLDTKLLNSMLFIIWFQNLDYKLDELTWVNYVNQKYVILIFF